MTEIMDTGIHKLHLSNGRIITLMRQQDGDTVALTFGITRRFSGTIGDVFGRLIEAWVLAGVRYTKYIAGAFTRLPWGHTDMPDLVCELRMYRNREIAYGPDEIDGERQVQWYVHLNKPVTEIPGALDENGQPTEEFVDVVCEPLWDMGLQGTTPLSSYSPTGRTCTSFGFHIVGRRAIVSNRHYRDI